MASYSRLCIFCRRLEPTSEVCPQVRDRGASQGKPSHQTYIGWAQPLTPFSAEDAALLESLKKQPSSLCQRCAEYDMVAVFKEADPLDPAEQFELGNDGYSEYLRQLARYQMPLGLLSDLHLTPACPLCRLVYRILPRHSLDPDDDGLRLTPIRMYEREFGWEALPMHMRSRFSLRLGLSDHGAAVMHSFIPGDPDVRLERMRGEVIAMQSRQAPPDRRMCNARLVSPLLDFARGREALELCQTTHSACRIPRWPAEMSRTRVVDVVRRKTVPCPDDCDYVALSYVWGGVMPAAGALQGRTLPRTIEDAITVTQKLGKRYLWVDSLCIEQNPTTPAEVAERDEQLGIMHLIYECASITVMAIAGSSSNSGLAGVSPHFPRYAQSSETIGGHDFFTVPPVSAVDMEESVWRSRAWTLQEGNLSRRKLYLSQNQARFECEVYWADEAADLDTHPAEALYHPLRPALALLERGIEVMPPVSSSSSSSSSVSHTAAASTTTTTSGNLSMFATALASYTSRRMTNASDSINAFLGMLAVMQRRLFPQGFVSGLPLRSHPQSLTWLHDRRWGPRPERRAAFPSWSWSGWAGLAVFPDELLEEEVSGGGASASNDDDRNSSADLTVEFVSAAAGNELVLHGWTATLDVRTEPFATVLDPRTGAEVGSVKERNFLSNDTLLSGRYTCLVVQRVKTRLGGGAARDRERERQRVFLILLDWVVPGRVAQRRTLLTLTPFLGGDFMCLEPTRGTVTLV